MIDKSPQNDTLTLDLKQTAQETHQLGVILARLMQVIQENGFQVSVDIVGITQNLEKRIENSAKQAEQAYDEVGQLRNLLRTFTLITSTLELDQVLEEIMDTVIQFTGAERAYLMLKDRKTGELSVAVARNWDRESLTETDSGFSRSIVMRALNEQKAILATNAATDDRFLDVKSVVNNQLRSIICVPLIVAGEVLGVLYADNRITQDIFHKEEIPLLSAFGAQAAIAIENARRYGEVKASLDKALNELQSLQIQIDKNKLELQVNQITETDYFQRLTVSAKEMRQRVNRSNPNDPVE